MMMRTLGITLGAAVLLTNSAVWAADDDRDPAKIPVVYSIEGMERSEVRRGVVFGARDNLELQMDLYFPQDRSEGKPLPAIVFVGGAEVVRDWEWFISYGRLAAAMGVVGIIPDKRYPRGWEGTQQGFADTELLLEYLEANAGTLGVDARRLCLWTFSAGGRLTAVGLLPEQSGIRCLVSFYGVLDVSSQIEAGDDRAAYERQLSRFSPVHSVAERGSSSPPVFLARAGKDSPGLNASIERFALEAIWHGAEVNLVSYPDGDHGFDGLNDTERSRQIVRDALGFARDRLLAE